ncbi:MAG: Uma2 family endonuclease [Planctomycetes bacterium]|nr:Uma2 family endonuclease [Planctomycetota bacterium]
MTFLPPNFLPPSLESSSPEYAWEVAMLYPPQGLWTESEYLTFTDGTNHRIEFNDGRLEFLAMPTEVHEELWEFLFLALRQFVNSRQLGKVRSNGMRVRTIPQKYRLPDVLFLGKENFHKRHNRAWDGIDLAMEIVSDDPKDRQRDYVDKLAEYAAAGIAEYWIIDYQQRVVIVNKLVGDKYTEHGRFTDGDQAASVLLAGFAIDVKALFEAADEMPQ